VPLPSNRRPIVPRVCFCGNVFCELLPSNEYIRHYINHFGTVGDKWTEKTHDMMNPLRYKMDNRLRNCPELVIYLVIFFVRFITMKNKIFP
jgi:hypothetical protein